MNPLLRHLSLRVPWHDTGWDGRICKDPKGNSSCVVLRNIREEKDDDTEARYSNEMLDKLPVQALPPCIGERSTFMWDKTFVRTYLHRYKKLGIRSYGHFKETPLKTPPYSTTAVPFRWMLRESGSEIAELNEFDVDLAREPDSEEWLAENSWFLDH